MYEVLNMLFISITLFVFVGSFDIYIYIYIAAVRLNRNVWDVSNKK